MIRFKHFADRNLSIGSLMEVSHPQDLPRSILSAYLEGGLVSGADRLLHIAPDIDPDHFKVSALEDVRRTVEHFETANRDRMEYNAVIVCSNPRILVVGYVYDQLWKAHTRSHPQIHMVTHVEDAARALGR